MFYNYLDVLPHDLFDNILNYNMQDIEKQIDMLERKINNLENKLKPLNITKYNKFTEITYDNVFYFMKENLFSNIKEDIVLLNIYNDLIGDYYGSAFISNVLHNPTYLDVLIEANKSVIKTKDTYHKYLDGLYEIEHKNLYNYTGIVPNKYIKYYDIMMGS
tara:strand:+ start:1907 stop:2389 length:483 start_codon:yes stop_codon:yes gene_type:complete